MPPLLIASANSGKLSEFQRLLSPYFRCISHSSAPRIEEIEETGSTYFENSLRKATSYFRAFGGPVLADDSGLEVDALEGAPGVQSHRFGGAHLSWPERFQYLQNQIEKAKNKDRSARFRCVLCYWDGQSIPQFFEGVVMGEIAHVLRGEKGFGYDPIFYSNELDKTFGESTPLEKDKVSHRGKACRQFLDWMLDRRALR